MRGILKVIMGPMFAGKTDNLERRIEVMRKYGKKKVLILKPTFDTRSGAGQIKNFHEKTMDAIEVPEGNPAAILNIVYAEELKVGQKFGAIAIDEVQFFKPEIYGVVNRLLELGYNVICAGLHRDFKNEPFGSTLLLIALCDGMHNVTLLHSYCSVCGKPAHLTQRLLDGAPDNYNAKQEQVGGVESYQARCYDCHELPGKPGIG